MFCEGEESVFFLLLLYYLLIHRVSGETFLVHHTVFGAFLYIIRNGMGWVGLGWSVGGLGLFRRSRLAWGGFFSFFLR